MSTRCQSCLTCIFATVMPTRCKSCLTCIFVTVMSTRCKPCLTCIFVCCSDETIILSASGTAARITCDVDQGFQGTQPQPAQVPVGPAAPSAAEQQPQQQNVDREKDKGRRLTVDIGLANQLAQMKLNAAANNDGYFAYSFDCHVCFLKSYCACSFDCHVCFLKSYCACSFDCHVCFLKSYCACSFDCHVCFHKSCCACLFDCLVCFHKSCAVSKAASLKFQSNMWGSLFLALCFSSR